MQLPGLEFLLLGGASCFDLRRLFRQPYRGPICVIEIIGAELTPIANRGIARSLYPSALLPPSWLLWLGYHFGRAAELHQKPGTRLR